MYSQCSPSHVPEAFEAPQCIPQVCRGVSASFCKRRLGFQRHLDVLEAICWWWDALQKIRQFKVLVPVLLDTLEEVETREFGLRKGLGG